MGLGAHFFGHRRIVLAAFVVAALVAFVLARPGMAPAGPAALTVNSTANTSDGLCDDTSCTLREAIGAVNAGPADTIQFDPAVFPPASPAVIDVEGGDGALPSITADITFDATGAGIIIDGDTTDDGAAVAQGLKVEADHADFRVALEGDDNFTLRDIGGHAIDVVGNSFGMDDLTIDAVAINHTTGDAIRVSDVQYATNISLSNSTIDAGNAGIRVTVAGPDISSMDYQVFGNDIRADAVDSVAGPAVSLNMTAGLAPETSINYSVEDNARIEARRGAAINLNLCSSSIPCALTDSDINLSVAGNALVAGEDDAVLARLRANPAGEGSANTLFTLFIDDNDLIDGGAKNGIDIKSNLCCGTGNQQIITANGNGGIHASAGEAGTDIRAGTCCDSKSGTDFEVIGNTGPITGGAGPAVGLELNCCGTNFIDVEDNEGFISSTDNFGIQVQNCVTHEEAPEQEDLDCLQGGTVTLLTITGNQVRDSNGAGIYVCCGEFQLGDERSQIAGNTVTGNEINGIGINSSHGITVGPGNVLTGNGIGNDEGPSAIRIDFLTALMLRHAFDMELPANGITVTQNEIHENGGLGIDLVGFNPASSPNYPSLTSLQYGLVGCEAFPLAEINANNCLASPALNGVVSDSAQGQACAGCRVEVFLANDQPPDQPVEPTEQHGEGETFLAAGTAGVLSGDFSIPLPCNLKAGLLTATATDADGNTSEFSANLAFSGTGISGACIPTTATPTGTSQPPTTTSTPPPLTATPTAVPPTATPTTVPVTCGDVNGDRSVNSIDAALVLQYTAGLLQTLVEPQGADVNDDGDINSIDAALILQQSAGFNANLHC